MRDTRIVLLRGYEKVHGADLPAAGKVMRRARQIVSIGETYDFEVTPDKTGDLRLEVRTGSGVLLATMPLVVK